jgi:hypothetical protein
MEYFNYFGIFMNLGSFYGFPFVEPVVAATTPLFLVYLLQAKGKGAPNKILIILFNPLLLEPMLFICLS